MSAQPRPEPSPAPPPGATTRRRELRAAAPGPGTSIADARVVATVAIAALAAAAIHVSAAIVDADEGTATVLFFAGVATAQVIWGLTSLVRAPRVWLALGALGNLAVALVWVWSRTAGLPAGEAPGVALPVTFPDTVATVLEVGIVVGGGLLALRRRSVDRAASRAPVVTIAAAVVLGGLALVAVLAQTGAIPALAAGT